jgi:hypothetical protein
MLKEIHLAGSVRPNAARQILIEAGLRLITDTAAAESSP